MRHIILLHGMKRSGNHALVHWIRASGRVAFFNNIIPIGAILRGEKEIPPPAPIRRWLRSWDPVPYWHRLSLWGKHALLFSLEDHSLEVEPFTDLPLDARQLLILRDPYNLFASRIRKAFRVNNPAYARQPGPLWDRAVNRWKEHAREFLGDTNRLSNRVNIYFNRWFSSPAYREALSERLGLALPSEPVAEVSDRGGGSSFDSQAYDGRANEMNVLERVSQLSRHERELLEMVTADDEVRELHHRIERHVQPPVQNADRAASTMTGKAGS